MSGRLVERNSKEARSFAEGAQRQVAGGVIGDNPHGAGTPEAIAWQDGFYAAVGAVAWAEGTFAVGQLVTNDTPKRVYHCEVGGTSAASPGPTGTNPTGIVDGNVQWGYMATGSNVDVGGAGIARVGDPPYVPTFNTGP